MTAPIVNPMGAQMLPIPERRHHDALLFIKDLV